MISQAALTRRLKRYVYAKEQEYMAVCAPGLEETLRDEIQALAPVITITKTIKGGVLFKSRIDAMYEANLHLSTATRVLLRIDDFPAASSPALFNRARRIRWELYIGSTSEFRLSVTSRGSRLNHKRKIQGIFEAAILERLRELGITTRMTKGKDTHLEFLIRLNNNRCTISFNTSGESLHKRGWRSLTPIAPIRETLAAFVLRAAQYRSHDVIVDPFCGSGTLIIEAARGIAGRPPGAGRRFAFEVSPLFEHRKWERIRVRGEGDNISNSSLSLYGSDVDSTAIDLARRNAQAAGVATLTRFDTVEASMFSYRSAAHGASSPLLVSNLPYGKRVQSPVALNRFLDKVNRECSGWSIAVVCLDTSHLRSLRVAHPVVRHFQNGGMSVTLVTGQISSAAKAIS